jgi:hypothetical protein
MTICELGVFITPILQDFRQNKRARTQSPKIFWRRGFFGVENDESPSFSDYIWGREHKIRLSKILTA